GGETRAVRAGRGVRRGGGRAAGLPDVRAAVFGRAGRREIRVALCASGHAARISGAHRGGGRVLSHRPAARSRGGRDGPLRRPGARDRLAAAGDRGERAGPHRGELGRAAGAARRRAAPGGVTGVAMARRAPVLAFLVAAVLAAACRPGEAAPAATPYRAASPAASPAGSPA